MALLRLIFSPCTTYFSAEQQTHVTALCSLQNPHKNTQQSHLSLSHTHNNTRSSRLLIKTKRHGNLLVSHFSSPAQEQTLEPPPAVGETGSETDEILRNKLYAQNVPWDCSPEDIRALFEKYGTVEDVELSMYNKTRNRGLAFVTMGSPEEALAALNNLQSYELEGRVIKIDYARPRKKKVTPPPEPKPEVTFNLFVANLSFEARAKDLREFFNSEGHSVVSAEVIFHENPRRSLGYGFVSFKSKKEAEAALSAVQGKIFMGRPIRVARSKQFVKQPIVESAKPEDTSTALNTSTDQN